ncbi:MAG TPA: glycosyltransferase family 1 protein [bacterium]|nr:glycosyltransferase family 1 protein [bacterium]
MRILLVTDAWHPQVNGVVRTLDKLQSILTAQGHEVLAVTPDQFAGIPCPFEPQVRLALRPGPALRRHLEAFRPEAVHIATEGPLGLAARQLCVRLGLPFTTAYHTRFPEYLHVRLGVPEWLTYRWLRWFHGAAAGIMVTTASLRRELQQRGFAHLLAWCRGVDTELFRPQAGPALPYPRPIMLYVGRLAPEKNLEAFLKLPLPGSKVLVGDGHFLPALRRRHPEAHFLGEHFGEDLARLYSGSDVFVFPSRTDTYGLVLLEALACGVPVAAFPVPGPLDVLEGAPVGCLDEDLATAISGALRIDRARCRAYALDFSWERCAEQFVANLRPIA